jgi:hypothetical protein
MCTTITGTVAVSNVTALFLIGFLIAGSDMSSNKFGSACLAHDKHVISILPISFCLFLVALDSLSLPMFWQRNCTSSTAKFCAL